MRNTFDGTEGEMGVSERGRVALTVARYLVGCLAWWLWLTVCFAGAIAVSGLLLSLVDVLLPATPEPSAIARTVSGVMSVVAFAAVGVVGGWIGGVASTRLHLDIPTWWAPSVTAMSLYVLVASIRRFPVGMPQFVVGGVLACLPVLGGQLLAVRSRRKRDEAGSARPAGVASGGAPGL